MVDLFDAPSSLAQHCETIAVSGIVSAVRGLTLEVSGLIAPVGTLVSIGCDRSEGATACVRGEVVGLQSAHAIVMLLSDATGVRVGQRVRAEAAGMVQCVGISMLGRVLNAMGDPIDDGSPLTDLVPVPLKPAPLHAMRRARISQPIRTGVRAIDLMAPMGRGQRLGIFAGPGVGKSSLLGQIATQSDADANVIALIGERGREVREFVEDSLGDGLQRSVVVVATGDETPTLRVRAALLACSAAEYLRDCGMNVMLMMDSITRLAHAQRQIGLAAGEPPTMRGYTPSVFSLMASIMERAGAVEKSEATQSGSITGLYTILMEGDDTTEPVSDAARGILDGHIMLSRKLAQRAHYPAIDVLDSVSRLTNQIAEKSHVIVRNEIVKLIAKYREIEELVQIGAYAKGSDPIADRAIALMPSIDSVLMQSMEERESFEHMLGRAAQAVTSDLGGSE
ncbi:MAG: FliI/YscN family ATPase [Phycisphaeraceae bacterium]|nr:FliI/YscN family ATPase [Phycisphaerales bacterium]MCB9860539.1 FliI/YscN family ATPase [Phycisphaeraceae bacterium]